MKPHIFFKHGWWQCFCGKNFGVSRKSAAKAYEFCFLSLTEFVKRK